MFQKGLGPGWAPERALLLGMQLQLSGTTTSASPTRRTHTRTLQRSGTPSGALSPLPLALTPPYAYNPWTQDTYTRT